MIVQQRPLEDCAAGVRAHCHPERREGSLARVARRFLALLGMTKRRGSPHVRSPARREYARAGLATAFDRLSFSRSEPDQRVRYGDALAPVYKPRKRSSGISGIFGGIASVSAGASSKTIPPEKHLFLMKLP